MTKRLKLLNNEKKRLLILWQNLKDKEALEKLILANMGLVIYTVKRYSSS